MFNNTLVTRFTILFQKYKSPLRSDHEKRNPICVTYPFTLNSRSTRYTIRNIFEQERRKSYLPGSTSIQRISLLFCSDFFQILDISS